ncbi:hypothetical protein [Salmonella enterica]|uniref:hypothetical protein n=1 Tax=Salmonella enterica TaxID=28901 RepID=UPI0012C6B72C|nr:hypothetical protein [Salmonella enterica]EBK2702469.1 hypothetical protein [Salmonella enterica subsp. enterica serovar Paratyphi B]ECA5251122.1 hypothetical protein [Salmonella enterica subsp. enterica serovar Lomalinda]EDL3487911.1 hypothetical protein [Salmonella enterica subsp. enterica serovar Newport]EDV4534662.1 hypothetical protein [Salmonella enterica subsp. enterica]EED7442258.1 hypothetical protein [Salmonella enterica subsp. salamae]
MPGYYKISHSWEYRRRTSWNDVLLESLVTSDTNINTEETLVQWLNDKEKGTIAVDYKNITCWYYGGVWLHYAVNNKALSLYMHSSGEDAFDSLNDCAYEIAKIFYKNHPGVDIQWIEHPHKRNKLKETTKYD